MAKRWTDTDKWKDDWYIQLSNDDKVVWQWLLDNCNHAGICKRSIGLLNLMCKVTYKEDEILEKMDGRVFIVGNSWFIPKFLKFQYSSLLTGKPAIVSAVKELFSMNCIKFIPESFGNDYLIVEESFDNHYIMIKDKDKDKDKDIVFNSKNKKNGKQETGLSGNFKSQGEEILAKRYSENLAAAERLRKKDSESKD
jgi:hypothetical protein